MAWRRSTASFDTRSLFATMVREMEGSDGARGGGRSRPAIVSGPATPPAAETDEADASLEPSGVSPTTSGDTSETPSETPSRALEAEPEATPASTEARCRLCASSTIPNLPRYMRCMSVNGPERLRRPGFRRARKNRPLYVCASRSATTASYCSCLMGIYRQRGRRPSDRARQNSERRVSRG